MRASRPMCAWIPRALTARGGWPRYMSGRWRDMRGLASDEAGAGVEADALIASDAGVTLGVFVADCIPALIVDPRTGAFAAAHAGWRGTVAGVLPAAVRALAATFGARPGDLRVALGPAIGACCFEVGGEVVDAFKAAIGGAAEGVIRPSPRGLSAK